MSLLEQQNAVARLLTDPDVRTRLLNEPNVLAREFGLLPHEIDDLLKVTNDSLGTFAESLVNKRLKEVSKLLPITRRVSGERFRDLFLEFAPTYNPRSVNKHHDDAVAFCGFIERQELPDIVKDAGRFERTRSMFVNRHRRFAGCRLHYKSVGRNGEEGAMSPRKLGYFAVWFRVGRRVFHFVL